MMRHWFEVFTTAIKGESDADKPYRVRVFVRMLDGKVIPMTNPDRYSTDEAAAGAIRLIGLVGIRLGDGQVITGTQIVGGEVIDTRNEAP